MIDPNPPAKPTPYPAHVEDLKPGDLIVGGDVVFHIDIESNGEIMSVLMKSGRLEKIRIRTNIEGLAFRPSSPDMLVPKQFRSARKPIFF